MTISTTVRDSGVAAAIRRVHDAGRDPAPGLREGGNKLLGLVQLGFRRGADPYGVRWKPVKRGGQPLRDTSRLRNSFGFRVANDELVIGTNVRYAPTHQYGAVVRAKRHPYLTFRVGGRWVRKKQVTIPARPMLPDARRGLPRAWSRTLIDSILRRAGLRDG